MGPGVGMTAPVGVVVGVVAGWVEGRCVGGWVGGWLDGGGEFEGSAPGVMTDEVGGVGHLPRQGGEREQHQHCHEPAEAVAGRRPVAGGPDGGRSAHGQP